MRHQHLEIQGFNPGQDGKARTQESSSGGSPIEGRSESLFQWPVAVGSGKPSQPNILDELLRIREYERQHLAQELHDSAGQLLVALELSITHLKLVEKNCGHDSLLEEIQETARQIDREIRSLAFLHYPVELGGRCLYSALQSLVLGFGKRTGIHTIFKYVGDPSPVTEPVSMAILRVVQESLVNVHRHSHASSVKVALERRGEMLHLTIYDDGVGFPPDVTLRSARGIGLQGMCHRIEMLGGRFRIKNLKNGAKLSAVVPVSTAG